MKTVTRAEFEAFIAAYPRPLAKDIAGMFEPPLLTYNDFGERKKWTASVVASVTLGEPREYRIRDTEPS